MVSSETVYKTKKCLVKSGKDIMIDGQQRVTALMTAIMGMDIINADFQKKKALK